MCSQGPSRAHAGEAEKRRQEIAPKGRKSAENYSDASFASSRFRVSSFVP